MHPILRCELAYSFDLLTRILTFVRLERWRSSSPWCSDAWISNALPKNSVILCHCRFVSATYMQLACRTLNPCCWAWSSKFSSSSQSRSMIRISLVGSRFIIYPLVKYTSTCFWGKHVSVALIFYLFQNPIDFSFLRCIRQRNSGLTWHLLDSVSTKFLVTFLCRLLIYGMSLRLQQFQPLSFVMLREYCVLIYPLTPSSVLPQCSSCVMWALINRGAACSKNRWLYFLVWKVKGRGGLSLISAMSSLSMKSSRPAILCFGRSEREEMNVDGVHPI